MIRFVLLIAGCLGLTACTTPNPAPPTPTEPIAASPTATPDASPAPAPTTPATDAVLALDPEGLRLVNANSGATRSLPFGMEKDPFLALITNIQGEPSEQGVNEECGAGPLAFASWPNGLTLWFADGRFVGWMVDGRQDGAKNLSTLAGISTGSTRTELESALTIDVQATSLGTEFAAGGLFGLLSDDSPNAQITNLWSGTTCIFR